MRSKSLKAWLCTILCASTVLGMGAVATGRASSIERAGPERAGRLSVEADPLAGWTIFRSANTPAASEVAGFRAHGELRDAELMERIAKQPVASWFTTDTPSSWQAIRALTKSASRHGAAAVIVAYAIPGRGCTDGASADVAQGDREYLRWIGGMAAAIGARHTVVILEPDAIPFAIQGCHIQLQLLARAVADLARASGARVYVDAGNPSWIMKVGSLVAPLREADIRQAAGFSLNVANFQTNAATIAYGRKLSNLLGGAHFVIDTGRNGNGPDTDLADGPLWCNPPGRALGTPPTTNTGVPDLDAYLWIKAPGSSDGSCRPGEPNSSGWLPQYALELAANAHG